jgi:hypothetical protein
MIALVVCLIGLGAAPPGRVFTRLGAFEADGIQIAAMTFSPDGKRLAVGGRDPKTRQGRIVHFPLIPGKANVHLYRIQAEVTALCFRADGKELAAVMSDGEWAIWDPATEELIVAGGKGDPRAGPGRTLALGGDGRKLVVGRLGKVVTWETVSVTEVSRLARRGRDGLTVFAPGGGVMAVRNHQDIDLYDTATGKRTGSLLDHPGIVQDAAFGPDGRSLVAAAHRADADDRMLGELILWDVPARRVARSAPLGEAYVYGLTLAANGRLVAVHLRRGDSARCQVRLYTLPGLEEVGRLEPEGPAGRILLRPEGHTRGRILLRPDGRALVIQDRFEGVQVYHIAPLVSR